MRGGELPLIFEEPRSPHGALASKIICDKGVSGE
jgi:hypothetical protein